MLHNDEHVAFDGERIPEGHIPDVDTRAKLGIWAWPYDEEDARQGVFLVSDPLVDMLGLGIIADIPVYWNPQDEILYGGGYALDTFSQLRAEPGTCLYEHVHQIRGIKVPWHKIIVKEETGGVFIISLEKKGRVEK